MTGLIVRPASAEDAAAISGLVRELGYELPAGEVPKRLAAIAGAGEQVVFVAVSASEIVGWLHVAFVPSLETETFAEIRGLVVSGTTRGAGVGSALVARAEAWARQLRCPRIRVRTNVKRARTHDFYRKQGFSVTKTQTVFDKPVSPL